MTRYYVMCLLLLAVVMLNTGCGECAANLDGAVTSTFSTNQRYTVEPRGHRVVPLQVEETITMVRDALHEYDPDIYSDYEFDRMMRLIDSNTIRFVGDIFPCDSGWCEGIYDGPITVVHHQCIGETSLVHELIHQFESLVGGKPSNDDDHGTPGLFDETAGDGSIEDQVKRKQCSLYCEC